MKDLPNKADEIRNSIQDIPSKKEILDAMFKAVFGEKKIKINISNKMDLTPPVTQKTV